MGKDDRNETNIEIDVIAIGASTGGTEALYTILKALPKDMPPIVIVQHMPPIFTKMFAERLNNTCLLEVKEAENEDRLYKGRVLLAPGDFQMKVVKKETVYYVECFKGEKVNGHCPSIDVLFNSVADAAGNKAVGVILTGMGKDGAQGLLKMRQKGAKTLGQDEETCVVYGMPKVAFEIGAVEKQAAIHEISGLLKAMVVR